MNYIVIDTETANAQTSSCCQLGIVTVRDGVVVDKASYLIDPELPFDAFNAKLHGIDEEKVDGAQNFPAVWEKVREKFDGAIVTHYGSFDKGVITQVLKRYNLPATTARFFNILTLVRDSWPKNDSGFGLKAMSSRLGISLDNHHDALADALAAQQVFEQTLQRQRTSAEQLPKLQSKYDDSTGLEKNFEGRPFFPTNPFCGQGEKTGPFYGRRLCVTGETKASRAQLHKRARAAGFTVLKNVTLKCNYLVVGKSERASGKEKKAVEYQRTRNDVDLRIITEEQLLAMLDNPEESPPAGYQPDLNRGRQVAPRRQLSYRREYPQLR